MNWQSSFRRRIANTLWRGGFSGLLIGINLVAVANLDWFLIKHALRIEFRDVQWITTAQLSDWLQDAHRFPPILLDVRTRAEWEVSHLPGARWLDPESDPANALAGIPKKVPVVTYCSVGYRSAKAARRLQVEGYSQMQNLEGS